MQTITITLDLGEIIYDIQNKTYLTGKSRLDGTNHAHVANMQANDDDENANQILRSISMAFSNLKTKLSEYLELTATLATNEPLQATSTMNLVLKMPSNYNPATASTIAAAAHQYIVAAAIKDWFTITHKTDAIEYGALADTSLSVISEAVNKRMRPKRASQEQS